MAALTIDADVPDWLAEQLRQTLHFTPAGKELPVHDQRLILQQLHIHGAIYLEGGGSMCCVIPGADPVTKEGVGVVYVKSDDHLMVERAESIQGVHLEQAAVAVLNRYAESLFSPEVSTGASRSPRMG